MHANLFKWSFDPFLWSVETRKSILMIILKDCMYIILILYQFLYDLIINRSQVDISPSSPMSLVAT